MKKTARAHRRPVTAVPGAEGGQGAALLLAAMALLVPALGVPGDEMLQDTLKSALVAFAVLAAVWHLCWARRALASPASTLVWHPALAIPLALAAWAAGSTLWSHTYLGTVEAVRWVLFALLMGLGMNSLTRQRLPRLALALHAGAVIASLWAALQFWFDWRFFAQGPNPASTFVNRNFFAEYAVCVLPFSLLLLAQARSARRLVLVAASTALVIVAIGMTGTRAALLALWVQLLLVAPLVAWRCRAQLAAAQWDGRRRLLAAGTLALTLAVLAAIPTGNARIAEEGRGLTPAARALHRTQSITLDDPSLGLRRVMWSATLRMIAAHPLAGVGAGAWEVEVPRFQGDGAPLETDYYAHNEFLQLLAEYGGVAWGVLAGLVLWLVQAAVRTWRRCGPDSSPDDAAEGPWRATALASLLALFIVSNVGFAWRLAATGAVFALCLSILAGSDARMALRARRLLVSAQAARIGVILASGALVLAAVVTWQAAACEWRLVQATRMAMAISASGRPEDPPQRQQRQEMLRLVDEAIAINPHYRKITPMVADELARWGDWANATRIWESVLASRPHVVALLTNAARGQATLGNEAQAWAYLDRAKALQPAVASVRSLEVVLLARRGLQAQAYALALDSLDRGLIDLDLLQATFLLAQRTGDAATQRRVFDLASPQQQAWMRGQLPPP